MKYLLSLVIISTLLISNLHAQIYPAKNDSTFTFYTETGIGLSFPQHEFKFDPLGENTGYAKRGILIHINAKAYKSKYLGFNIVLNGMLNPADESFYSTTTLSATIMADIGMWKNINFGFGPILYYSNESFLIELSFPVGFNATNRPEVLVYNYYSATGSINYLYTYTGGNSLGFCFTPEIALLLYVSDNLQLRIYTSVKLSVI